MGKTKLRRSLSHLIYGIKQSRPRDASQISFESVALLRNQHTTTSRVNGLHLLKILVEAVNVRWGMITGKMDTQQRRKQCFEYGLSLLFLG